MRTVIIALALVLVGCSKMDRQDAGTSPGAEKSAPAIAIKPTDGIALTYQYVFRLPIQRIAEAQEQHASQCERLGPGRCRITGMTYQVGPNRTIEASLALKLAPDIARQFGKRSVDTTISYGGMLAEADISSEEAGATIAANDKDHVALVAERQGIERQLATTGLGSTERAALQARLQGLRDADLATRQSTDEARMKLASTPMAFRYLSGGVDPGLSDGPMLGAIKDGWENIIAGVAILLMLSITLIPWAVAGLLLLGAYRWLRLRLRSSRDAAE